MSGYSLVVAIDGHLALSAWPTLTFFDRILLGQEVGQTKDSPGPVNQDQVAAPSELTLTYRPLEAEVLGVSGLGLWCFT